MGYLSLIIKRFKLNQIFLMLNKDIVLDYTIWEKNLISGKIFITNAN